MAFNYYLELVDLSQILHDIHMSHLNIIVFVAMFNMFQDFRLGFTPLM